MKFLCLPGGYNNAKTFEAQLRPLCDLLQADASFFFTQGNVPVAVPAEYDGFFGPPPNYTFFDADDQARVSGQLRHFPRRDTSEDTVRYALELAGKPGFKNAQSALDGLIELLDREGDLDGVIGYSEGARIAGSLVLEEAERQRTTGRTPRIKCALFLAGWQPVSPTLGEVFADETDVRITIPTCHVVGSNDPFVDGALCLYNLCDHDCADLFDHGAGHVLPREKKVVMELADVVRDMIAGVEGGN